MDMKKLNQYQTTEKHSQKRMHLFLWSVYNKAINVKRGVMLHDNCSYTWTFCISTTHAIGL